MSVIDKFDLTGRTALVTGATRGMGRAFARALAEAGADIVIHGRDEAAAAEVSQEITALGRAAYTVMGDLTDSASVQAVVDEAGRKAG